MSLRVMLLAGARPNFMKVAPLHRALAARGGVELCLCHTGQHYDTTMSQLFFDELGIPAPNLNLEVGSASHAQQTAEIMRRFEPVALDWRPDLVVVVGDVNSTAACALVAKKIPRIGLAHVEAGLRSFDWTMPEEINRIVTDALSDLLFTSERSADRNLRAEGAPAERIHFVGNVMIDTLLAHREQARRSNAVATRGLSAGRYALLTLHRPATVDRREVCEPLLDAIAELAGRLPVVFPVHPRTRETLAGWAARRGGAPAGLLSEPPIGYLEFLHLMSEARMVLTDSGGIQEETTVLGVPCLTLRENTERPVTLAQGTNTLVGRDPQAVLRAAAEILAGRAKQGGVPEGWDGRAAERIADVILGWDRRLR